MTDSPAFKALTDPAEQPILDSLLTIRDKLLLLKQDKTKYVQSKDVVGYYDEIIVQVDKINAIRANKRNEQNRLDTVLDDCLQLTSLFFMTIGRNNEAPAAYSMVSTIKRLLDHLKEAAFFAGKDLNGIAHRLDLIQESVERSREGHSASIVVVLEARISTCREILAELQKVLSHMDPELESTHEKLVSILRSLSGCNARSTFPLREVQDFRKQLKDIESKFDGRVVPEGEESESISMEERLARYAEKLKQITYEDASQIPGKEVVRDLLERTLLWSDIMLSRRGKLDPRFVDLFNHLNGIRQQLEKLSLTQAWSLRETDLYSYQRKLDRADESRVNGNFVDDQGKPAELYESRTLLYLLRRSYATIFFMLTSSEPVSEALQPIYNQLTTLRKCLVEVKRSGGVASPRELYPYSMKLNSIDNMRQDGKFVVNGDIPEGQASVIALLSECFDMAYELRNEAEKEEDEKDEDKTDGRDSGVHMESQKAPAPPEAEEEEEAEEEPTEEGADLGLTRTVTHQPGRSVGVK